MSHSLLLALTAFGAVMAFTPGPNNIMVLSSGLTYGFRRSLPHIAGIAFGIAFMVAATGLGLGAIFFTWPILQTILKYAGIAYLLYLAWIIAMSGRFESQTTGQLKAARHLGADAALSKPFTVEELLTIVGNLVPAVQPVAG